MHASRTRRVRGLSSLAGFAVAILVSLLSHSSTVQAQTPAVATPEPDTAIVFQPVQPLLQSESERSKQYRNSIGFDASFSDYGFGGGAYYSYAFSPTITGELSVDVGTAKGSREFGFDDENKINRIFVIPLMLSAQYRLFQGSLSDNLRPYVTLGAGPVVAMTTPYSESYLTAFADAQSKVVPGGFVGAGANFGSDRKSNFGANIRYYIIPYPGTIQSTSTQSLSNLSGLFLTVNYGINF